MITPKEIKEKALKLYTKYLSGYVFGKSFEPLILPCNKKVSTDFAVFAKEVSEIMQNSKNVKGIGYTVKEKKITNRMFGEQIIPDEILFETETDFLTYIGKEKEAKLFKTDTDLILDKFSELKEWIAKYPQKIIDHNGIWNDLLKVCTYFQQIPCPNLYIRELPIEVHTKFIENNEGILKELLDIIIKDFINDDKSFEKRFNLKYDEPKVRFRILDETISQNYFSNISDLSIPISQFETMQIPIQKVYIVENQINMLTFPTIKNAIVIWGHGFGVDIMKNVKWMENKPIYYWGDLDAHGFQILSEIRTHFNQVKSFLMNKETFDKFYEGDKGKETNVENVNNLTSEENELFKYLKENNYRLEQEKIPYEYANNVIMAL